MSIYGVLVLKSQKRAHVTKFRCQFPADADSAGNCGPKFRCRPIRGNRNQAIDIEPSLGAEGAIFGVSQKVSSLLAGEMPTESAL
jgi:hypothetical protein